MTKITIYGDLAKLNEHDKANRSNRYVGAALKKKMTDLVATQCMGIKPFTTPVKIGFHWFYSGKHDFDNQRFSAKYCLDGLVHAGVLVDDNQKWVKGFTGDLFYKVDKGQERVIIEIDECDA
jgi:Holliday junction resolvase RusA-like endonuclease